MPKYSLQVVGTAYVKGFVDIEANSEAKAREALEEDIYHYTYGIDWIYDGLTDQMIELA